MSDPHVYECRDCERILSADEDVACVQCGQPMKVVRAGTTGDRPTALRIVDFPLPNRVQSWLEQSVLATVALGVMFSVVFVAFAYLLGGQAGIQGFALGLMPGILISVTSAEVRERVIERREVAQ